MVRLISTQKTVIMKKILVTISIILFAVIASAQAAEIPYFSGFETKADTAGWQFSTRTGITNRFVIGKAVHRIGAKAMYVSANGGDSAYYINEQAGSVVIAYRRFAFTKGVYDIKFDLMIEGKTPTDVFRLACFPTVGSNGNPQIPLGATSGNAFPPLAERHAFADENKTTDFSNTHWRNVQGKLNIAADGDYWLAFYFKEVENDTKRNLGACIDNIQIDFERGDTDCTAAVKDLDVKRETAQVDISWKGNAAQYQLMYYNASKSADTTCTVVSGITSTTHSIPVSSLALGSYNFRVRPICSTDTGLWVEKTNILVYNPQDFCIDYLNFYASGVKCAWGDFDKPSHYPDVVDYGPDSKESVHTIHYRDDEYDRLTGYKLKTVPDGTFASVRLSNWSEAVVNSGTVEGKATSGSIEYSYTVRPDATVLLLNYAAVLQYSNTHKPERQTRIHVQILDPGGKLLSDCTEADFNAQEVADDKENIRGWQTYQPSEGEVVNHTCPVKWLNWTTLGINLEEYINQPVKIRLTLYACGDNFHFAYAYFALSCSQGDIEGMSCSDIPTQFTAPEGFKYRWYKMSDGTVVPDSQLSDECRVFTPLAGDTCSYFVDLIYPENDNCKFTLRAYMLPRVPFSDATFKCNPRNCQNEVDITNKSAVYSYPKDLPPILRRDTIDSYFWDFGEYGKSTEKTPQLIVPLSGDTFTVTLRTVFNGCDDVKQFTVEVPAVVDEAFGDGPNVFETDTAICSNQTIDFFGQTCNTTGTYTHYIPSEIGCDTIYHILHLTVLTALDASIPTGTPYACQSDAKLYIPVNVVSGTLTEYSVNFTAEAIKAGFADVHNIEFDSDTVVVDIPSGVTPGRYSANITLHNADCGDIQLSASFEIRYPATIITQRWNDVLAIKNDKSIEGKEFTQFKWFLDNTLISTSDNANYYSTSGELHFDQPYTALLFTNDNDSIYTCPFYPVKMNSGDFTEVGTVVFSNGGQAQISTPAPAIARIYTATGTQVASYHLNPGENTIPLHALQPGIYIVRICRSDTDVSTHKLLVK